MPVPNPDYDPNWKARHNHAAAERARLSKEIRTLNQRDQELYDSGNTAYDSPERLALREQDETLQAESDKHDEICRDCVSNYQHATIQDAAKWVFGDFDPDMGSHATRTVHHIDFEKFTTIEEVSAAWAEANDASKQIDAEKTQSLPIGQPDGNDIFQETSSNQVSSTWHTFSKQELHSSTHQHIMQDGCEVLVTVDQRDGEYHICFMQDLDMAARGGLAAQYQIEALATAMYKRAYVSELGQEQPRYKALSGTVVSGVKGVLSTLANAVIGKSDQKPKINPGLFHFYIHHPPAHREQEQFMRIDMDFKSGQFKDAKFNRYNVIPEIIQKAPKDVRDVSQEHAPRALPLQAIEHDGRA